MVLQRETEAELRSHIFGIFDPYCTCLEGCADVKPELGRRPTHIGLPSIAQHKTSSLHRLGRAKGARDQA